MGPETVVGTKLDQFSTSGSSLVTSDSQSLYDTASILIFSERQRLPGPLYRLLLFAFRLFLYFTFLILSPILTILSSLLSPPIISPSTATDVPAARALVHVLGLLCRVTAASRKHEVVRSLAERLLDDNFKFSSVLEIVNRAALTEAFSQAVRLLEEKMEAEVPVERLGLIARAVRYGMRRWSMMEGEGKGRVAAEEVVGEMMWMAQKLQSCGAGEAAVEMWGRAERLGRLAVVAEPRVQVALARLSVFLFKHASKEDNDEKEANMAIHRRGTLSMLRTWLPLLCRVSNSVVTTVIGSTIEKEEMVRVLEKMIEKLSWEEQEEVLALWIQHFTLSPDSDWPNLECCYIQWYNNSRERLFLK